MNIRTARTMAAQRREPRRPRLPAAQRVFQSADGVLHPAGRLLALAFSLEFGVAGDLASDFLDLAPGLPGGALDAILVHCFQPPVKTAVSEPAPQRFNW